MSSLRRTIEGQSVEQPALKRLQPDFRSAYLRSLRESKASLYVTVIGPDGSIESQWSREDLDLAARHCADQIESLESADGVVITISENSASLLAMYLGALLSGRQLCPLNPDEGAERLRRKIEQIGQPNTVWISENSRKRLGNLKYNGIIENVVRQEDEPRTTWLSCVQREKKSPFILMFTSGTTGGHKIVEQLEAGVLSNVDALIERHQLTESDAIATPLPLSHVNALEFSFFSTLLSRAKLVLLREFSIPALQSCLDHEYPTILSVIPGILKVIEGQLDRLPSLSKLKYAVSAAAPLSPQLARTIVSRFPFRVLQGYGLSEAVNFSCLTPNHLSDVEYRHWMTSFERPTVGTPLRGNDVFILSPDLKPLGPGVTGQIGIRGPGIMKGYRDDSSEGWCVNDYLLTGDLGHFIEDERGQRFFFVTGRLKDIIKRHGKTISLVEVDDLLSELPIDTTAAIAVGFANEMSSEEIGVALSRATARTSYERERLSETIVSVFPTDMRPRAILVTDRQLRTASGKPRRWDFASSFEPLREAILGTKPVWLDEGA